MNRIDVQLQLLLTLLWYVSFFIDSKIQFDMLIISNDVFVKRKLFVH